MRERILFSSVLVILLPLAVWASWSEVKPAIQQVEMIAGEVNVFPDADHRVIYYWGDSLSWAAEELARHMRVMAVPIPENSILTEEIDDWSEFISLPANSVILGTWNAVGPILAWTELPQFQRSPEEVGQIEGYYILVREDDNLEYHHKYISASSLQGMKHAVTSFWKAVEYDEDWTIETVAIVDFPSFPKRGVGIFTQLNKLTAWGGDDCIPEDGSDGGGNVLPGPCNDRALADSILDLASSVLIEDKASMVWHDAHTKTSYYSDLAGSNITSIRRVLDVLENGYQIDAGSAPDPHRKWNNFSLDWYEGIGWNVGFGQPNSAWVNRGVQIACTCAIASTGTMRRLTVMPKPVALQTSFDCDYEAGAYRNWAFIGATPLNPNPSTYMKFTVGGGTTGYALTKFKLQENYGLPSRQMMLRYDIRSGTAGACTYEILMDLDPYDDINVNDAGDFLDFVSGGENEEDIRGMTVIRKTKVRSSAIPNSWDSDTLIFNTYGAETVRLFFIVKNSTGSIVEVNLDDIEIIDVGFLNLFEPVTDGQGNDMWNISCVLSDGNTEFSDDIGETVDITPLGNGALPENYSLEIPEEELGEEITWQYALVKYWALAFVPKVVNNYNPDGEISLFGWSGKDVDERTDNPDVFSASTSDQMSWYIDEFSSGRGMTVTGYGCGANEFKAAGWITSSGNDVSEECNPSAHLGQLVQ